MGISPVLLRTTSGLLHAYKRGYYYNLAHPGLGVLHRTCGLVTRRARCCTACAWQQPHTTPMRGKRVAGRDGTGRCAGTARAKAAVVRAHCYPGLLPAVQEAAAGRAGAADCHQRGIAAASLFIIYSGASGVHSRSTVLHRGSIGRLFSGKWRMDLACCIMLLMEEDSTNDPLRRRESFVAKKEDKQ